MTCILNKTSALCRSIFHKNIVFDPVIKISRLKIHSEHVTNKINAWTEKKYKQKDNINSNYQLVYREQTTISRTIILTYHFGWVSLVISGLTIGYLIYMKPPIKEEDTYISPKLRLRLNALNRLLVVSLIFAASIVLIIVSKMLPLRIYHSSMEKMYKAVFVNAIFGKKQIETFGEHTIVPIFNGKRKGDLLFNINGRIVLLDKESFSVQSVREQMIRKTT
ncbi:hypothetical protein P5V15_000836 [Pogonomyrmex californicus]